MQNALKGVMVAFVLVICAYATARAEGGTISTDTEWSGTVDVDRDVLVNGGTLTIAPGTILRMATSDAADLGGNASKIGWQLQGAGAIYAVGTEAQPIVFTSAAASPAAGDWGGIDLLYLTNDAATQFSYCTIEYGTGAFHAGSWSDSLSWETPSDLTIDNCIIRYHTGVGIYATSDATMDVSYTTIHDVSGLIFWHGIKNGSLTYSTGYNASHGLVFPGAARAVGGNVYTINHYTQYNIDMLLTSDPKWWTGYGLFPTNDPGTLTITNSIFMQATLANYIARSDWTTTENNNCWYTGMTGLMNIESGTPDATDITGDFSSPVDPLFVDAANGDFRIVEGSPVIDAGSDGLTMGSYVGTPVPAAGMLVPGADVHSNAQVRIVEQNDGFGLQVNLPEGATVSARVFDQTGTMVRLNAQDMAAGSGILPLGSPDMSGIYFVVYSVGGTVGTLRITIVR